MELSTLKPPPGAVKMRKRIGRGTGSGHGKTSGRGHKGQKSRSGFKSRAWFEGGQMPLQRRLPKRGFKGLPKARPQIVNVGDISKRGLSGAITPEVLKKAGLIKTTRKPVKILGGGGLDRPLEVKGGALSKSAAEKIVQAGGRIEVM